MNTELKLVRFPKLARRYPRDFTFYVPDPISSIDTDLFLLSSHYGESAS